MTGHGEARRHADGVDVAVELRAVNNRYLKVSTRLSEGYGALEPEVESLVRQHMRRGTLQVNVRIEREASPEDYRLNETVLAGYRQQLEAQYRRSGSDRPVQLEWLLGLPGVVREGGDHGEAVEAVWPLVEETLRESLQELTRMRAEEGAAMGADLRANGREIAQRLQAIEERAPLVVDAYRRRLTDRLNKLLEGCGVSVEAGDVVREVGVFAERSDISEEIVRLRSHLEQFSAIAEEPESNGRKLEFVIQEMLRETNTIGSKANDAEIARHVVDIKTVIERMREMIQNVE
jgi:uncharacterized protein (TIGR00255 family)